MSGWVGVDLDGTLAMYTSGQSLDLIGSPVYPMLAKIHYWLQCGLEVRVFTARVGPINSPEMVEKQRELIQGWLVRNGLPELGITATKDLNCVEIWDDKAVGVIANTGMSMDPRKNNPQHIPGRT